MNNKNEMISEEELDNYVELFDPVISFIKENYPNGFAIVDKNGAKVYDNSIIAVPSKKDIEFVKRFAMFASNYKDKE